MMTRLLLLLLLILLTACRSGSTTAIPSVAPVDAAQTSAYPDPSTAITAYPEPTLEGPTTALPLQETMVSPSTGAIRGVLLDTEGKPVSNIFVFLATVTPGPTLDAPIISFTLDSPKGSTDAKGQFVIKNVPAGIYSLAVWTPATNALIPPPNGKEGSAIQVEVINNRITDVGELRIVRPR